MNVDKNNAKKNSDSKKPPLTVYLPEGLDLDTMVAEDPYIEIDPEANSRREAGDPVRANVTYLKGLVGIITYWIVRLSGESDKIRDDDLHAVRKGKRIWVGLSSDFLRKNFSSGYKDQLRWLIDHEVILENPSYSNFKKKEKFTKSYTLTDRYYYQPIKRQSIRKKMTYKEKPQDEVTKHLNKWIADERFQIDFEECDQIADGLRQKQKDSWMMLSDAYGRKDQGHRDNTSHRYHSILTRTATVMRGAITFTNENLVAIDIRNSQPFFLAVWMKRIVESSFSADSILLSQKPRTLKEAIKNHAISFSSYWNNDSNRDNSTLFSDIRSYSDSATASGVFQYVSQSDKNAQNSTEIKDTNTLYGGIKTDSKSNQQNPIVCITNEINHPVERDESVTEPIQDDLFTQDQWKKVPEDAKRYIRLNIAGRFYETLAELWGMERNDAKKAFMVVLFGKNKQWFKTEQMFAAEFPSVYRFIREKKKWGYKYLAVELQQQESNLVLNLACTRLMEEYPEIPLWTIHDSIVTIPEHIDLVEQILREECAVWYGTEPNIKREYWADIGTAEEVDMERENESMAEVDSGSENGTITSAETLPAQNEADMVNTEINERDDEDYRKKMEIVRRVDQLLAEEKPERKPVNLSALLKRAEDRFRDRYGLPK